MQYLRSKLQQKWALATLITVTGLLLIWRFLLGPGFEGSDSNSRIAEHLLTHGNFITGIRPPLYPLFLAGCMWLTTHGWEFLAALLQGIIGCSIGVLLGYVTKKLGGSNRAVAITILLYATHFLFQIETTAKRDTVFFTFLLVCFVLVIPMTFTRKTSRHLSMAATAALAFLLRGSAVVLVPILMAVIVWDYRGERFSHIVSNLMIAMAVFCIIVLPWQITLSHVTDEIAFSSAKSSGQNLLKGNNEYFFGLWPEIDVDAIDPLIKRSVRPNDFMSAEADEMMEARAMSYIRSDLGHFVKATLIKFFGFFNPVPTPYASANLTLEGGTLVVSNYDQRNMPLQILSTIHFLVIFGFWIVSFAELYRTSQAGHEVAFLSLFVLITFAMLHAVYFPETRYRLPFEIVLVPFTGFAIDRRLKRWLPMTQGLPVLTSQ